MFGFKLINNDGNVSVDETNPVYAFLDINGAVTFEDPKIHTFNFGSVMSADDGNPMGSAVNLFLRFAQPLQTEQPPLLFGRDRAGSPSATIISGVAAVGTPGNWLGIRMAFTTTHPDANSSNPVVAYMAARQTACEFAVAVPGGSFYPGVSLRVADAQGRLIFDALNHHPSYEGHFQIALSRRYQFTESIVDSVSVYQGDYTLEGTDWIYLGSGSGMISRPFVGVLASSYIALGRGKLVWVGTRFSTAKNIGDVWTNVSAWRARTRRRVTSPLILPAI